MQRVVSPYSVFYSRRLAGLLIVPSVRPRVSYAGRLLEGRRIRLRRLVWPAGCNAQSYEDFVASDRQHALRRQRCGTWERCSPINVYHGVGSGFMGAGHGIQDGYVAHGVPGEEDGGRCRP
jgi:hypothetical protein